MTVSDVAQKMLSMEMEIDFALNDLINDASSLSHSCTVFYSIYQELESGYKPYLKKESFQAIKRLPNEYLTENQLLSFYTKHPALLTEDLQTLLIVIKRIKITIYSPTDFYLSEFTLSDYHAFNNKAVSIDFQKGLNLIVGNNGTGKTTILDAISLLLARYLKAMSFTTTKLDNFRINKSSKTNITGLFYYDYNSYKEIIGYTDKRINPTLSNGGASLFSLGRCLFTNKFKTLFFPVIAYYRISSGINNYNYTKEFPESLQGYIGCLNGGANLKEASKWLERVKSEQANRFLSIVNQFFNLMNNRKDDTKQITWDCKLSEILFSENNSYISINKLSSGYKQLINLIIDLSFRAVALNPLMENPSMITGIVLIDEIDLHLHPKWQWNVLPALLSSFPNIQFILTTHSPFILSSSQDYNLMVLSDNIIYRKSVYGKSISDIAKYELGTSDIPEELADLSIQFDKAWRAGNREAAELYLEKIGEIFGESNSIYISLKNKLYFRFN